MENHSFVPNGKLAMQSLASSDSATIERIEEVLDTYVPRIPSAVVQHLMNCAGLSSSDPLVLRLISIASEKFISDIVNDALQHLKMKPSQPSKGRAVLTLNELSIALKEHGIIVKKPPYFR